MAVLRFYEDLCSFLLDLCVMADENDLANACKFIEGTSWSFCTLPIWFTTMICVFISQDVPASFCRSLVFCYASK